MSAEKDLYKKPVEILQNLIRINTTNPPGNEGDCIRYIQALLKEVGIESTLLSKDPKRPNLIARVKGQGKVPPLLLYGHLDVVTTEKQDWKYPPFEGKIADGYVWGRGTLDMKGGIAMMLSALIRAKAEGTSLPGDVVFCAVCDEEVGGEFGARFLVENHPELFKDIRYALGEFGGFSLHVTGKKFYPIEIAQKKRCSIKATIKGPSGHGSMVMQGGAVAKLGRMCTQLDQQLLPVHITPAVKMMFEPMTKALPFPAGFIMGLLLKPGLTNLVFKILGEKGKIFLPLFRNTVNATIIRVGDKLNVIPSEVSVEMDARLLPGCEVDELLQELHSILGHDVELEVLSQEEGPADPNLGLFNTLAEILKEADPEGIPIPLLLTGTSDARFFSRLGIQTYGYLPMQLPEEMNFSRLLHAADERIPVESVQFGADAIFEALKRFHE
jgi:acetylornithine deacetylase/succinyl-diaminopimelate desuccinylase-like protein